MLEDIKQILLTKDEIDLICQTLGQKITNDYQIHSNLLLVGLLKGCNPFMSDLMRYINLPIEIAYMDVKSYSGTKSTGEVQINLDLDIPVSNRDILIVEDIIDTGKTINTVSKLLLYRGAKSVRIVSLLDKPAGRNLTFTADYIGKTIPNEFVVGYGLDYNQKYRNLPFVGVLKKSVYSK